MIKKNRSVAELEKKDLDVVDVWSKYEFNEVEKKEISKRLANENQNKQRLEIEIGDIIKEEALSRDDYQQRLNFTGGLSLFL